MNSEYTISETLHRWLLDHVLPRIQRMGGVCTAPRQLSRRVWQVKSKAGPVLWTPWNGWAMVASSASMPSPWRTLMCSWAAALIRAQLCAG